MGDSETPSSVAFHVVHVFNHLLLQIETSDLEQHASNCIFINFFVFVHGDLFLIPFGWLRFKVGSVHKAVHYISHESSQFQLQVF